MGHLASPLASPLGGDIASATPENGTHVASALSRLAYQFKDRPNIVALIRLLVTEVDNLEAVLQELQTINQITESSGAQLDLLGHILGEPRQGATDSVYKIHLLARVWLNRGSGTPEDLYATFKLLLPGYAFQLSEYSPASFIFRVKTGAVTDQTASYMRAVLSLAKPAGVWAIFHYLNAPAASSFSFDGGTGVGFENGTWSSAI